MATRTSEAIRARWEEIDRDARCWINTFAPQDVAFLYARQLALQFVCESGRRFNAAK